MLSVDEARARILSKFSPLSSIEVGLMESLGLVLAEDVIASEDIPPFRNSAMDGFAVRSDDTVSASPPTPVRLMVGGEAPAGHGSGAGLMSGSAIRIMTGAPMPDGSDAVVPFEDVALEPLLGTFEDTATASGTVVLSRPVRRWQNVRQAGEDVARGSRVLGRGTVVAAAHVGLLAALNRVVVRVIRRPEVAILATGDEVIEPGQPLGPGQIRNSNSYLLAALTRQFGGKPEIIGVARDSEHDITSKLGASRGADLLVTSGGVSVGDFDVVKHVLRREGSVELWQVRIKPGKPIAFGHIGETPLLGLPGNPVAAAVAFIQFGRPAVRRMLGLLDTPPPMLQARLEVNIENHGHRRHYVRGNVRRVGDDYVARPVGQQGSGMLAGLAQSNCFIVIPEDRERMTAEESVRVELIDESVPL